MSTTITNGSEMETVVRTALAAAAPVVLAEDTDYAFRDFDGQVKGLSGRAPRATPLRKTGTVTLFDGESFAAYVTKHAEAGCEIYADALNATVVALLNGHEPNQAGTVEPAGWGDHRAVLKLRLTTAWQRWVALDRKLLTQVEFAEHLEDRLIDITNPPGADLLELAQSFHANTTATFSTGRRLDSGETQLTYVEQTAATAGRKQDMTIPSGFDLALMPFDGANVFKVTCRLRYRIGGGELRIGYLMDRPDDILRAAYDSVLAQIEDLTKRSALHGTPPGSVA
ncbi:MAG: YfdQ family protein [Actinomycetota bacterium]|nr:YfdQ family protein [Actinomycetota bacterium]